MNVAFAEIDKFAKQSYKAIYDTENEIDIGDITQVGDEYWQQFKGKCDIIVGGTPCQSFSIAGKRKGFEDTRGQCSLAMLMQSRMLSLNISSSKRKGLISHDKGNTIRTMLLAFDEIGYELDFDIFNSKCYGVPQNRERIYIVGRKKDENNINYGQQNIFEYI